MLIRSKLPFSDPGVSFEDFVPTKEDGALRVELRGGDISALLYVTEESRFPAVEVGFDRVAYFQCLTAELTLKDPDPGVLSGLLAGEVNEAVEAFGLEVFGLLVGLQHSLTGWWRNTFRMPELEDVRYRQGEEQRLLSEWGTEWRTPEGDWRPLVFGKKWTIRTAVTIRVSTTGTMDRRRWEELAGRLAAGRRPGMIDVLITNAYQHLEQESPRLAVVEAVSALESALKQWLPDVVASGQRPRMPGKEAAIRQAATKVGLRESVSLLLPLALPELELGEEAVVELGKAVALRNAIVHGPMRSVKQEAADRAVYAVDAAVTALQAWREKQALLTDGST